jgi:hypothetical protein
MRLHIETWVSERDFSIEVNTLFEESAKCYKVSAYRAALLFSFLAFQTIIKERILKSTKPDRIHEHQWNSIHKNLRNDDFWDAEVIECIKKSDPNKKIFEISEDLRQQAIYWKNRRNDCAHSKRNIITDSHVESFWYFLKANLNHFVLPGSQTSLLNKVKTHFDTSYTPEDKPFDYLINECKQIIDSTNVSTFIKTLFETINEDTPFWLFSNTREMDFLEALILADQTIFEELTEQIKQDNEIYKSFIQARPSRVQYFLRFEDIIRKTWKVDLLKGSKISLQLLAALLLHEVIPSEERINLYSRVIKKGLLDLNVTEVDLDILLRTKFIEQIRQAVFIDYQDNGMLLNNFEWGNKNVNIALFYLANYEIEQVIVRNISNAFLVPPYPFKAQVALKEFFSKNPVIKGKFVEIAEENNIILPESLGFQEQ